MDEQQEFYDVCEGLDDDVGFDAFEGMYFDLDPFDFFLEVLE